jgi:hypothetical protein
VRVIACFAVCLISFDAHAAEPQPQSYCVNLSADFYPYTGKPCKSGYQLGPGNCRNASGEMVAVTREQCLKMGGAVELQIEQGAPAPRYFPK